jgi:hypothetical protein
VSFLRVVGHPFAVVYVYFADRIPPEARGKVEDFMWSGEHEEQR